MGLRERFTLEHLGGFIVYVFLIYLFFIKQQHFPYAMYYTKWLSNINTENNPRRKALLCSVHRLVNQAPLLLSAYSIFVPSQNAEKWLMVMTVVVSFSIQETRYFKMSKVSALK